MARTSSLDNSKIERTLETLKQPKWYQKWWGILILGIVASAIVGLIFLFI